jgi:retron-type reverse transcriptase
VLIEAMKKAGKGKHKNNRRHSKLREYRNNPEKYVDFFINYIQTYYPEKHFVKVINDGISAKIRKIIVPTAEEVVLHNAIVIVLKPILTTGMYEHSYACIEGRGIHSANRKISKWIREEDNHNLSDEELLKIARKKNLNPYYVLHPRGKKNRKKYYSKVKYVLKMDIKQFFNSVNIDLLAARFKKVIRDKRFLDLVIKVLKTVESGLALGYTTSHWFANWLLTPLDHYIKENLKISYYIRFVDDMVLFSSNKKQLHRTKEAIETVLKTEYDLELKDNWQVFMLSELKPETQNKLLNNKKKIEYHTEVIDEFNNRMEKKFGPNRVKIKLYKIATDKVKEGRFLDFLGFKFHRKNIINSKSNRIGLRKSIALKIKRKANHIYKKKCANIRDARQIVTYAGYCKYCNCYQWFYNFVLTKVSISKMRKKISEYDKKKHLKLIIC